MSERAAYLWIFDGFADWEPSHAMAELRRSGQYRTECVAIDAQPVRSMGGLTVVPSKTVADVAVDDVAILVVPGGERWETAPVAQEFVQLLRTLHDAHVPIAAICAATTVIASTGLLRGRRHTSNGLEYLRSRVPHYTEAVNYVDMPAVRDRKLITASGLGDVEFAREIFEELQVLTPHDRILWADMFRRGSVPT
jgi:putative intracellular protease/amidase